SYGRKVSEFAGKKATNKDGNVTYAKQTEGILLPEYRLPTEVEWEYAAKSLNGIREYNSIRGRKKYPWAGRYTRNGKRAEMGNQMANFKQGQGDYGGLAGWSEDKGDITTKVKTFAPNDFGLYDMAGNVAEWVADVYRPRVDDELSDFNYYRGNVYTKNKIGEDGKLVVVDAQSITYDTLSNGRIIARNLPGQLAKVAVDDNETYLRYNFTTADNRNYRDGDRVSSKEYSKLTREGAEVSYDSLTASQRANVSRTMYNSPNQRIIPDGQGGIIKVYDRSNDRTTLIDDEARVIKGGSWRDRAYWMDPAQRRYLPQYSATDYIGFRCAMSRVGSKAKKGKSSRG
ncbi:gliding motility lipoprotein GldJ, partial [Capnocytophaga gingivalis]|uniref:gliding motility lipoprotein GldJ n=1 Tax=Capnocytophaga gingivalis TaxID=1017 RepID=UPI0023523897